MQHAIDLVRNEILRIEQTRENLHDSVYRAQRAIEVIESDEELKKKSEETEKVLQEFVESYDHEDLELKNQKDDLMLALFVLLREEEREGGGAH